MNTIASLFYIVTMSLIAPVLWATFVPAFIRLLMARKWHHYLFAAQLLTVTAVATISWYYRIIVPFVDGNNAALSLPWGEWVFTILVWPTAIFSAMFLSLEYQKVKLAQLKTRVEELTRELGESN